jgi:hypothetical protein
MKDTNYTVTIEGIRPLLQHNGRLCNPLDEHTKKLKAASKQRNKSDDDHMHTARVEFEGSMYFDPKIGPFIPTDNLQAMVERGATRRKLGKIFKAHVGIDMPLSGAQGFAIAYKGPRTVDGLWADKDGGYVFMKGARVGTSRVMRTRVRFAAGWKCTFGVEVLDDGVSAEQLEQAIADAGIYEGIGDWRPRYGRFTVSEIKKV